MASQPDFAYLERTFGQARGHFLDIGSGVGYSWDVTTKRGWAVQDIEPGGTLVSGSRD
ncbi:MAG: hypothetical protein IPN81_03740 [Nitrosomonadales bacterium]|nr:hypothetical protein [Nitrosomonadales bacterium]MBL0037807.1 hypothetical protein [Nitrosomonadales bacterium]